MSTRCSLAYAHEDETRTTIHAYFDLCDPDGIGHIEITTPKISADIEVSRAILDAFFKDIRER